MAATYAPLHARTGADRTTTTARVPLRDRETGFPPVPATARPGHARGLPPSRIPVRSGPRTAGSAPIGPAVPVQVHSRPVIQAKLEISDPADAHEREADRVADAATGVPSAAGCKGACSGDCEACRSGRQPHGPAAQRVGGTAVAPDRAVPGVLSFGGQPLDARTREYFEAQFGQDFAAVRVHTDGEADQTASAFNARALTYGHHIAFRYARYQPGTTDGRRLLAHELTHVVQQRGPNAAQVGRTVTQAAQPTIQRALGDGHDLQSPRFSRLLDLEAVYDNEKVLEVGASGRGVEAIQQALYDLGFPLPVNGANGNFNTETQTAVKAFQAAHPPLAQDGRVGFKTMAALDATFGVPTLPAPASLAAPWTPACVRSVLCKQSPHTINVLQTRITLKSFDNISWADEKWDGASWVAAPFPGGGYNTGTEIGVLNGPCEAMAQTLYHEVLHADQPTSQHTTLQKEAYAYRIGEEMSIALGFAGRPGLRSTDPQGKQFADPAKVASFVGARYPGVSTGAPGDQIIGKAAAPGQVQVQRPDGSIITRPAAVGEKVPGPVTKTNEVTHPAAAWTCP